MSQQLTDRRKVAAEYRAWLDANAPAKVGRDVWLAKWQLWRQTQDEIDHILVGVAPAVEALPVAEPCGHTQLLHDAAEWVGWAASHLPDPADRMAAHACYERIGAELAD